MSCNTTEAFQHGSPVTEDFGIVPTWEAFENARPVMFGLSIERPILDHHPKAHIHEIRRISWNLADFTMKSGGFHEIREIWWISPMKSSGFHPWNLADFTREIWWISWNPWNPVDFMKSMKSSGFHPWNPADFHPEIWQISWNPWNLADFTREIRQISPRYHLWNPPKIIKASVSAKTLQFDECRVGDFTLKSGGFQPWNLVDFTQISPVKST